MSDYANVYNTPEKFGLEVYGDVWRDMSWEFDAFIIWKQPSTGAYLWAHDSGCSCPTPFEDYGLSNLPVGSLRDALVDLRAWVEAEWDYANGERERSEAAKGLIERIEKELAG